MAAVTRRQYKGAAASTTTTNALTSGDTSVTLAATTGWPSTAAVPFYVVIDPGTSSEEKCSVTISGSTLTLTRGQDDTTAVSHSSGATIYPVFSADDADEANALASTMTTRGDIIKMGTGPTVARLAIGSSGAVLYSDGTDPAWASLSTAGIAPVASPTFTGTPAAPTAANGTSTTQLATTAYVYANGSQQTVSTKTASYTLVAADRNTKVVMNSASATTITVNTSLFAAGDTLTLLNIGAGVCTVTAGTCTVGTSGSLALAQNAGGTLTFISASASVFTASGVTASAGGLVPIYSETAFSGVTTITRDNIFTSTYTNYLIVLRYEITGAAVSMQLRVGGVTAATNYNRDLLEWASGASSVSTLTAQTSLGIGGATAGNVGLVNMFVSGPALAASTIFQPYNTYFSTVGVGALWNGRHSTATAYDGFIITGGANMSGTYTIYGYGKTA